MTGITTSSATLAQHRVIFEQLLARAERYLRSRRYLAAAVQAEIAANYAMSRHTGLFTSPRLEDILQAIGREAIHAHSPGSAAPVQSQPARPSGRILHVLTRAHGIGGDTRMVWRWIQEDRERAHSVVLTRQGGSPVPPMLDEVVRAAHGHVYPLSRERGDLLTWARTLREIAATVDTVVLHIHPYDIIPTLAFADRNVTGHLPGPTVIFADHADHAFWVGGTISDVIAGLRDTGAQLSRTRRGIPPERTAVLPIILPSSEQTLSRADAQAEAKRRLGVPESSVLLLSIARPHKYRPANGLDFLEGIVPVLERCPQALLWLIGPEAGEPGSGARWARAAERTGRRVQVLGQRTDTALYYQAADIYVDSFPIASITSLLEAGSYGLPLVSRTWPEALDTVLGADTPALARCMIQACDTPEEGAEPYRRVLIGLIEGAGLRASVGEHTRATIANIHSAVNWRSTVESIYRQADALHHSPRYPIGNVAPAVPATRAATAAPASEAVDAWLLQLFDSEPDLQNILQFHLQLMPLDQRLVEWVRLRRAHRSLSPGLLLPEWLGAAVALRGWSLAARRTA